MGSTKYDFNIPDLLCPKPLPISVVVSLVDYDVKSWWRPSHYPSSILLGTHGWSQRKVVQKKVAKMGTLPPKDPNFKEFETKTEILSKNLTGGSRNILEHDFVELTEESLRKIWRP